MTRPWGTAAIYHIGSCPRWTLKANACLMKHKNYVTWLRTQVLPKSTGLSVAKSGCCASYAQTWTLKPTICTHRLFSSWCCNGGMEFANKITLTFRMYFGVPPTWLRAALRPLRMATTEKVKSQQTSSAPQDHRNRTLSLNFYHWPIGLSQVT